MPICRFCDEDKVALVKAHIIPRSFFPIVSSGEPYGVLLKAGATEVTMDYIQAGLYDKDILCRECEALFGEWDTHGFEIWSKYQAKSDDGTTHLRAPVEAPDIKYDLFKLFVLSVLWRASVSKLFFFRYVELGPHENAICELLRQRAAKDPEEYSVLLGISTGQKRYKNVILPPFKRRVGALSFYHLVFPNMVAFVKVDKRSTHHPLNLLQLQPGHRNILIYLSPHGSYEQHFFSGLGNFITEKGLRDKKWGKSRSTASS